MEKPSRFVTEDGSAVAFLIECSKIAEYQAGLILGLIAYCHELHKCLQ